MILILGLILGVAIGLALPVYIPPEASPFVAIAILAGLDSVFGGFAASINHNFKMMVFLTGFFGNAILAAILAYIGTLLGVDLLIAGIVVFGTRLFQNFAIIRRFMLNKYTKIE